MNCQDVSVNGEPIDCIEPGCTTAGVHPVKVVVNAGGVITTINHEGTTVTTGKASGRGVAIATYYQCEAGHFMVRREQFHKGNTSTEFKSLGSFDDPDDEPAPCQTIWRD